MQRRPALIAIVSGVIAQLGGLALDSVLHARDASLVEREGVLSLSNPGHLLFAAGLALTVLGAAALLVGPRAVWGRRGGVRGLAMATLPALAVVALAAATFGVALRSGSTQGHAHPPTTGTQGSAPGAAAAAAHGHDAGAAPATGSTDSSRRQPGADINVSWEQLRAIDTMLTTARDANAKYRDVAVARADGYIQVTQVVPGLGAHFVQPALMASGVLDPAHPPILLYDRGADGGFELVGVAWTMPKRAGVETPPASPFGALGAWHYHTDLCFDLRSGAATVSAQAAAGCRAGGGTFVRETPWMLHAWLFRPSPEGVLSHQNSTITGVRPAAARR